MTNEPVSDTLDRVTIREAVQSDLPACARIICNWIDATDWMPRRFSLDEIEGFMMKAVETGRTIMIAECGGQIAAYLSMDDRGFIHAIYVDALFRRHGIGTLLLDEAKRRFKQIELTVFEQNADARRFYAREGLSEIPNGRVLDEAENLYTLAMRWRKVGA